MFNGVRCILYDIYVQFWLRYGIICNLFVESAV